MLLCGTREWPARDLISTEEHQDYIYIHQDHNDWVSQVWGDVVCVGGRSLGGGVNTGVSGRSLGVGVDKGV